MQGIVAEAIKTCRTILICVFGLVLVSLLIARHIDLSTLRNSRIDHLQGQVHKLHQAHPSSCEQVLQFDVFEAGSMICHRGKPASQGFLGPHLFYGIRISEEGSEWKSYPLDQVKPVTGLRFLAGLDVTGTKWLGVEQRHNGFVILATNREDKDIVNSEWIWIGLFLVLTLLIPVWFTIEARLTQDFLIPLRSSLMWIHEGKTIGSPCQEIETLRLKLIRLRHQLLEELRQLSANWAGHDFTPMPFVVEPQPNVPTYKQALIKALRPLIYPCFVALYLITAKVLTNPHTVSMSQTMLLITICVLLPMAVLRFLLKTSQTELELNALSLYMEDVSNEGNPTIVFLNYRQKLTFKETTHIINLWQQEFLQRKNTIDAQKLLLKLKNLTQKPETTVTEITDLANQALLATCNVGYLGWNSELDEPILSRHGPIAKPELLERIIEMLQDVNQSTSLHGPQ
jgi:hypothetical protein